MIINEQNEKDIQTKSEKGEEKGKEAAACLHKPTCTYKVYIYIYIYTYVYRYPLPLLPLFFYFSLYNYPRVNRHQDKNRGTQDTGPR